MAGKGHSAASEAYVSIPDGALDGWYAAKATSGQSPAWVTVLGDSIAAGFNSTDYRLSSWFGLLSQALSNGYGRMGDYWTVRFDGSTQCPILGSAPFAVNATGRNTAPTGHGYLPNWSSQTGTQGLVVFTSPYACTDLDLLYFDAPSGSSTWQYILDGGAAVTVTGTITNKMKRISLTGLSNTVHTLSLGNQNGDAAMYPQGVCCYLNRRAGIGFAQVAFVGQCLGSYGIGSWVGGDLPSQWQGLASATTGFGFPTQPHCAILALGINDCVQSNPPYANGPTSYEHNLRRMVQAFRRGQPGCAVVLLGYCNPSAKNSDLTSNWFGNSQDWLLYLGAMKRVADTYGCVFVNMHAKWGETPVTQGYLTQAAAHPNNAGHADIAAVLASIL